MKLSQKQLDAWATEIEEQIGVEAKAQTEKKSSPPKLAILQPVKTERACEITFAKSEQEAVEWVRTFCSKDSIVAFDIETKGLEPHLTEDTRLVGYSLATNHKSIYIEVPHTTPLLGGPLHALAKIGSRVIAHNLFFDGQWIHWIDRELFDSLNWYRCTYLSYKLLATEGWGGQKWGLKEAQKELLGWEDTNELELDEWLIRNGYGKTNLKKYHEADSDERWRIYTEENTKKDGTQKFKPMKGEMFRAPSSILGKYCCLDSHSTWLLWTEVLRPAEERFNALVDYTDKYMHLLKKLIEQKNRGISMDSDGLQKVYEEWCVRADEAKKAFFDHDTVKGYMQKWFDQKMQDDYFSKEPDKYLKKKKPPKEPKVRVKKDGELSDAWLAWEKKMESWEKEPKQVSKNWLRWVDNKGKYVESSQFNLNSNPQLCWLFYDCLGYTVQKRTKKGEPSIDKKVLPLLGDVGKLLSKYNIIEKERQYIKACLDKVHDGILHPSFRVPGTLTGRLAGAGGLNLQQVPKVRKYLECYKARPGYKWVQCDIASLEKVVLAERSKDEALWLLYGPDAKPNDVYLFDGAHMPGFKEDIIGAGYDPFNSTAEMIKHIKKVCKGTRKKVKPASLGFGYGMGPGKYQDTMRMLGINMTKDDAYKIWKAYWDLYKGVRVWEKELERQWKLNNGWFFNGIGRPIGIHQDRTKDFVNSDCLAEGTLVHIKEKGLIPIEQVKPGDEVWDGSSWVQCSGLLDKGMQLCNDVNGVFMTPDHEVLVNGQMQENSNVRMEDIETGAIPRVGWKEVWRLYNSIQQEVAKAWKNLCRRSMFSWNSQAFIRQFKKR